MTVMTLKTDNKDNNFVLAFDNEPKHLHVEIRINGIRLTNTNFLYAIFKAISLLWGSVEELDTQNGREYLWVRNNRYGKKALEAMSHYFDQSSHKHWNYNFSNAHFPAIGRDRKDRYWYGERCVREQP